MVAVETSSDVEDRSAPRPRPSPRGLFMLEHLPGELQIREGAAGAKIMEHHRLAVARRLRETDIARDHRVEDLAGKVPVDLVANLLRHARPAVEHRQDDAFNTESWIEALADELHGPE